MQGSLLILLILKELKTTRTEYPFNKLGSYIYDGYDYHSKRLQ